MSIFYFKYFSVNQKNASMKVGTDAMILGALIETKNSRNALDIGTGTGVISLMCTQKNPNLLVTAIDIDQINILLAQENFKRSNWANNLKALEANILEFKSLNTFDLIFSNPPFFINGDKTKSERKTNAKHVCSFNLLGFFKASFDLLTQDGSLWMIIPFENHENWTVKSKEAGFNIAQIIYINGKEDRCVRLVIEFKKKQMEFKKSSLTIRNQDGSYTQQYREMTEEFHAVKI